jgi:Tfp pilus assembly protein PilV
MTKTNQSGFSIVEALLILVVVGILGFTGWYVYHTKQTSDKDYSATNSTVPTYKKTNTSSAANAYAGWKTYSSSNGLGLSFKYPATWTVSENNPSQMCAGQATATATPAASEVEAAFKQIGASYAAPTEQSGATLGSYYSLAVTKAGQSLPKCGGDNGSTGAYNYDVNSVSYPYLSSTDQIQTGALKGDWFTIYGSVEDTSKADPDAMIISANQYSGSGKFTDSAILPLKGAQYQVTPSMGQDFGQYGINTMLDVAKFKTTDLYKDTLLILNSMQ